MDVTDDDGLAGAREYSPHDDSDPLKSRPEGRPYRKVVDVRSVSLLGIGMIAGVAIGAGIALLLAPGSGRDTRAGLRRRANRLRRNPGVWERLGEELKRAAAAKRKEREREAELKRIELQRRDAVDTRVAN